MADEITFQNDPVDPSVEFRKQHNHFFVAARAERIEPDRAAGAVLWKRMSLVQRVSYHQVTLQLEDYAVWRDMPEEEYEDEGAELDGPGWHTLAAAEVPAVVLVREGASLRLAEPAQHTGELDWDGAREWSP